MSKKPTGITITRNGGKYTASWKCGDKNYNDGQQFQYKINRGKWVSVAIAKSARTKAVSVNLDKYYPTTKKVFYTLSVRIRGKVDSSKSKWSDWATKTYTNYVPSVPSLSAELDATLTNRCKFTWNLTTATTDAKPYKNVRWETILVKESDVTDGSKLPWKSSTLGWGYGIGSASSSHTTTEDTTLLAEASYTRWFRVCARGAKGKSAWKYAKHVYARPYQPKVNSAKVESTSAEGLLCFVNWTVTQPASHPIDKTTVQFLITVPDENLTCPGGEQWEDANVSADTTYSDSAKFSIDNVLGKDECLFVRVNTQHDSNITYGIPTLAMVGKLKDPVDLTYQTNDTNHTLTSLSVDNESEVEDSFIVIVYRAGSNPENEIAVGIIPHGASQPLVMPVQCPDWSGESEFSIGAYAAVGTYSANTDGLGYTVVERMRSDSIWVGGAIPVAPQNVNAVQSLVAGTATVTWDWSWEEATNAQLSWTNRPDAWESTDEPEIYSIPKSRATKWNIAGLETGEKWYIAVRLVNGNPDDDTAIFGPWSDPTEIILSSAPNIPSLELSSTVITIGESITASWNFESTDGTGQISAEVCEIVDTPVGTQYGTYFLSQDTTVIVEEDGEVLLNGKTYYEKTGDYTYEAVDDVSTDDNPVENEWYEYQQSIAHTTYETEVVIDPEALGWAEGETHSLSVRVTSASNRTTDWSTPVSFVIAEALECSIAETSLVDQNIEVKPRSFSGDLITFETEMEEVFTKLETELDPIQDLHGYDKPWVGGAGKNKIPLPSKRGYWAATNGDFATDYTWAATEKIPVLPSTTYHISCSFVTRWCGIAAYQSDGTYIDSSLGDTSSTAGHVVDRTFTTQSNCGYIAVSIASADGQSFQPSSITDLQVELGSTATLYAPYENIAPISGHDDVEVGVVGKNLCYKSTFNYAIGLDGDGVKYFNVGAGTIIYAKVVAGQTYCISGVTINRFVCGYFDGEPQDNEHSDDWGYADNLTTYSRFTATKTGVISLYINNGNVDTSTAQVELGSTPSAFEPYNTDSTTYTTTLPSTTYGGTLDLVSGVLTVDRAIKTFDGTETAWEWPSSRPMYRLLDMKEGNNMNGLANWLPTVSDFDSFGIRFGYGNKYIYICQPTALPSVTNLASFKTYLGTHNLTVVYPLASPTTYQLTPQQIDTLLGVNNVYSDCNMNIRIAEDFRGAKVLDEMPLSVTLSGVNDNITATLTIERAADYHMDRPDETRFDGYEGEIVYLTSQNTNEEIIINQEDLIGLMDDGAPYRVYVTFKDVYGQSMSDSVDFEVHWDHQAIIPEASVEIDEENLIAKLTPIAPAGTLTGDTCDIYRLSADRPELIIKDAAFGTQYVDPYPAIGEFGGHRFVFKTANGDYITEDNGIAWVDTGEEDGDILESEKAIIDFDGNQLLLYYNVDVGHQWDKDFQQTKYLGGSIQGDWNAGVSRSGSVSATMITITDAEQIKMMRELAVYTGICHVRTTDGSSYAADVQVAEDRDHDDYGKLASFSLTVTRVDTETLDGLTYAQWSEGEE